MEAIFVRRVDDFHLRTVALCWMNSRIAVCKSILLYAGGIDAISLIMLLWFRRVDGAVADRNVLEYSS